MSPRRTPPTPPPPPGPPPVFRLVPDDIPHDVTGALKRMLHDAEVDRELVGIAYIGMYRSKRVVVANAAGEFFRNPDVARGFLAQLHDALGKHARGESMPGW